jgi:hypothetical protein
MFDLIFNGFAAFTQVMMLLGGFICLGIGALIGGSALHWRLRAQRVEGTVIGVRPKSKVYYSVYRYILPSTGETIEATSDSGSSIVKGRETGRIVNLRVFPDNPAKVQEEGILLSLVFGLIFFLPGLFMAWHAFAAYPVTPMTWIMIAGFLVFGGMKVQKHIIPKEQRPPLSAWKADRIKARAAEMNAIPVQPIEELLAAPDKLLEQEKMQKMRRWMFPLLLLVGIGMVAGGVYLGQRMKELQDHGLRTPGQVVGLEISRSSDSTSYHPKVSFKDSRGGAVTFRDSVGSNPPSYRTGDAVTVLYLEGEPEKSAIIDRGLWNWLVPALLALFGALIFFAGIKSLPARDEVR